MQDCIPVSAKCSEVSEPEASARDAATLADASLMSIDFLLLQEDILGAGSEAAYIAGMSREETCGDATALGAEMITVGFRDFDDQPMGAQ